RRKCEPMSSSNACFLNRERNDYFFRFNGSGSVAGEKPATLPEPLSQNALGSARIYVGADIGGDSGPQLAGYARVNLVSTPS
ncbi:MAG TPA: hypothetical protein VL485_09545, partial [Ktedonobacteraceae bacterium]|nr:hypothetical protein [Ktedonobacteraceae bacterium]